MKHRIIIVSNRLPVTIRRTAKGFNLTSSSGGLVTALAPVCQDLDGKWIGWTGLREPLAQSDLDKLHLDPAFVPVDIPKRLVAGYYTKFSNQVLWPVFHRARPSLRLAAGWRAYKEVSGLFASTIHQQAKADDVIWIQDYQLLLVPGLLRKAGLRNRIGLFLHTPFPDPDQFGLLPHGSDLLKSMMAADLLGFQTSRDLDNFRACAGRFVPSGTPPRAEVFPIGIDYQTYSQTAEPEVGERKVVFSLSRLDPTKGILPQLQAFERLIEQPRWRGRVTYRLVVLPSREEIRQYRKLKQDIDQQMARINQQHGTAEWQPVEYSFNFLTTPELLQAYRSADVMFIAPMMDGMNLVAKEYIAANGGDGALVLSRMAGAAEQLGAALLVDPGDIAGMKDALERGLSLGAAEKKRMNDALRAEVRTHDVKWWADSFITELTKD